jgi:hypothetical protein
MSAVIKYLAIALVAVVLIPNVAASGQAEPKSQDTEKTRPRSAKMPKSAAMKMSKEVFRPMDPAAAAEIGRRIRDQVQPCANRQTSPGPGAEQILVVVRLRLNRDGSLAAAPAIGGWSGVNDANSRYLRDIEQRAVAAITGCQPFRGLPPELYDGPYGWNEIMLRYKLPG